MELGLTQDTRRLVDFASVVHAARSAGFTSVGVVSGRTGPGARDLLHGAGLRCHEVLGLQVSSDIDATTAAALRLAEAAHSVEARWVLTTFEATITDGIADALSGWAAMFREVGAGLAVEFSPLGSVVSISDGLALIERVGAEGAGIVIDSWNFCWGPSSWSDLERVPLETIAYLQFADALAPVGEVDSHEALHRRTHPGDGVLDLDRFVTTLRGRGWDGLVSMQVLSE